MAGDRCRRERRCSISMQWPEYLGVDLALANQQPATRALVYIDASTAFSKALKRHSEHARRYWSGLALTTSIVFWFTGLVRQLHVNPLLCTQVNRSDVCVSYSNLLAQGVAKTPLSSPDNKQKRMETWRVLESMYIQGRWDIRLRYYKIHENSRDSDILRCGRGSSPWEIMGQCPVANDLRWEHGPRCTPFRPS